MGALAGLAAGLLAFSAGAAQAAFPGVNGRIAFTVQKWRLAPCDPTLSWDPYACPGAGVVRSRTEAVQPNGRGRLVLGALDRGLGGYGALAWSPRARLVAFDTWERIGIVRRDGTGRRLLPNLTAQDLSPAWSPDGRRLAFTGDRLCYGCVWLYTVRRDGTGLRRVIRQGGRLAELVGQGHARVRQLQRRQQGPRRHTRRPIHRQARRVAAAARLLGWLPRRRCAA